MVIAAPHSIGFFGPKTLQQPFADPDRGHDRDQVSQRQQTRLQRRPAGGALHQAERDDQGAGRAVEQEVGDGGAGERRVVEDR